MTLSPSDVFVDGGIIGSNPSGKGGTWAFLWILDDEVIRSGSGIIQPADLDGVPVSNNVTELFAFLRGICHLPEGWSGTVHTDSKVTLLRMTTSPKFTGIPKSMRLQALRLRAGRKWRVRLVGGHPTKTELAAGFKRKNGHPVSKWNVACDGECRRLAKSVG